MEDTIDYFFTSVSPFAWLGHRQLMSIAGKHGKNIRFRPFSLAGVWEHSGSVPLAQRTPLRQRYRLIELQRIALMRGVALNLHPAHFPTDPQLADRTVISLVQHGRNPADFAYALGEAVWSRNLQISSEAEIASLLSQCGFDPAPHIEGAKSEASAAAREENTAAAVAAGAIGAPAYVYKGEVFWGQDRLDHLDHMITTGRDPFQAI
jgi:2-hydroxychromene-2-carboxylate isomerase